MGREWEQTEMSSLSSWLTVTHSDTAVRSRDADLHRQMCTGARMWEHACPGAEGWGSRRSSVLRITRCWPLSPSPPSEDKAFSVPCLLQNLNKLRTNVSLHRSTQFITCILSWQQCKPTVWEDDTVASTELSGCGETLPPWDGDWQSMPPSRTLGTKGSSLDSD